MVNNIEHFSNREYAKQVGVSDRTVRRHIEKGNVVLESDGKVNPNRQENVAFVEAMLNHGRAGQIRVIKENPVFPMSAMPTSNTPVGKMQEELKDIRARKDIAVAYGRELKNAELRGKLVDKEVVTSVFNKLWAIHQSEFVPIANKVAPEMASMFGSEDPEQIAKARERLDGELWKVLGSIKRLLQEYLREEDEAS